MIIKIHSSNFEDIVTKSKCKANGIINNMNCCKKCPENNLFSSTCEIEDENVLYLKSMNHKFSLIF